MATIVRVKKRKPAMQPAELRSLMDSHGYNIARFAALLEVHRNTVRRWREGLTPISAANAALIQEKLKIG